MVPERFVKMLLKQGCLRDILLMVFLIKIHGSVEIDAISGATITTNAVTNGVNAGLYYFYNGLGGN